MTTYTNFSPNTLPRPPQPSHMPAPRPQQQTTDKQYDLSITDQDTTDADADATSTNTRTHGSPIPLRQLSRVAPLSEQSQRPSTSPNRTLSGAALTNAAIGASNPFLEPPSGPVSRPTQVSNSTPTQVSNATPTQANNPTPTNAAANRVDNPIADAPSRFSSGYRTLRRFLLLRWPALLILAGFVFSMGLVGCWFWYLVQEIEKVEKQYKRQRGAVGDGDGH